MRAADGLRRGRPDDASHGLSPPPMLQPSTGHSPPVAPRLPSIHARQGIGGHRRRRFGKTLPVRLPRPEIGEKLPSGEAGLTETKEIVGLERGKAGIWKRWKERKGRARKRGLVIRAVEPKIWKPYCQAWNYPAKFSPATAHASDKIC